MIKWQRRQLRKEMIKWQRRQLRKGKPFWVWDKFEIGKEPDGKFKLIDITDYSELGTFDNLKQAKEKAEWHKSNEQ